MPRQKGFTLIELLVVIAIIGILALTIFINITSSRAKARDARRLSDMHEIQVAAETYQQDCGQYPPTLTKAESSGCSGTTTLGTYLPVIPTDPQTHNDYGYVYDNVNDTYTVSFTLENGSNSFSAGGHTLQPDGIH